MRKTIQRLALILVAAGCGGGESAGPRSGGTGVPVVPIATTSVSLSSRSVGPSAIRVSPGALVTFTNLDGINHNLTFSDAGITSVGDFANGAREIVMPTTPGTYSYHCTIHAGMNGSVLVE